VLVASIMIPSAKILALGYLLITTQRGSVANNEQRIRMYRMVEFIGRWSMVDVFVDTFTAALIQLQPLMSVEAGTGSDLFRGGGGVYDAGVESFDPRADLGFYKFARGELERGYICLIAIRHALRSLNRRTCLKSARGSRSFGSSRSWQQLSARGAVTRVLSQGPEITIVMKTAEGLEAGKTKKSH